MQSTHDALAVERFWSKVDTSGDCWTWKAWTDANGYGSFRGRGAHRASWEIANGPIPPKMLVDHICRNPSCVRPDHLRLATHKQNLEHLAQIRANNTSGFRGVCWNKKSGYWQATVVHNYQRYFLGFFDTAAEAGAAAQEKRNELYTHNALDRDEATRVPVVPKQVHRCGVLGVTGTICSNRVRKAGLKCQVHKNEQALILGKDDK